MRVLHEPPIVFHGYLRRVTVRQCHTRNYFHNSQTRRTILNSLKHLSQYNNVEEFNIVFVSFTTVFHVQYRFLCLSLQFFMALT
jgi:hypothetical protein